MNDAASNSATSRCGSNDLSEYALGVTTLRYPFPKRLPPGHVFVGQLDWNWSPAHSRTDVYAAWLSAGRQRLFLWVKDPCSWEYGEKPRFQPCCSVPAAKREPLVDVGRRALIFVWAREAEDADLDAPHGVEAGGVLSQQALESAISEVWKKNE